MEKCSGIPALTRKIKSVSNAFISMPLGLPLHLWNKEGTDLLKSARHFQSWIANKINSYIHWKVQSVL